MKILALIFLILLSGCATSKKIDYSERRGLMLLENTELGRNKYIHNKGYQKKLNKTYKRLHK